MPIIAEKLLDANTLGLSIECPFCQGQYDIQVPADGFTRWRRGAFIQDAFPDLTKDEREQILTGICEKCWDDTFKDE